MVDRLLHDLRPHRRYVAGILACTLFYAAGRITPPLLARTLLDATLRGRAARVLGMILAPDAAGVAIPVAIVAAAGLLAGTQYLMRVWAGTLGQRVVGDLQVRLFEHLLRLPLPALEGRALGRHLVRFGSDMTAVRRFASRALPDTVRDGIMILAIGAVLLHLHPPLGRPIVAVIAAYLACVGFAWQHLRRASRAVRSERARIAGIAMDRLTAVSAVKLASRERIEARHLARAQRRVLEAAVRSARLSAIIHGASEAAVGLAIAISLGLGAREVLAGAVSRGELVAFYGLALMLFSPLRTLGRTAEALAHGRVAFERLYAIFNQPSERDSQNAEPLTVLHGEIMATGLRIQGLPVADLHIRPGITAVIAEPGHRKTSLGYLLVRLRDAEAGRVAIDGTDIARVTLDSLRHAVMYVSYPPHLLKGTLRTNLRASKKAVSEDAMLNALRAVGAEWSDQGTLRAKVGSGGRRLSGTQRWQVACARALLALPAVLVLDGVPYEGPALDAVLQRLLRAGIRSVLVLVERPIQSAVIERTDRLEPQPVPAGA